MSDRRAAQAIVLAVGLAAVGCGYPEQKVVDQYFTALNAKDSQTLGSFAVVSLDTKDKRVDKWTITQAEPERRIAAPLPDLVKKLKDAEAEIAKNKKEYNAYFLDHPKDVDEVRELLKKGAAVPARLQPYASEWKKFTEREKELKRALAEAREAVEKEKRNVALSIGTSDDLEGLTGEMVTKDLELTLSMGGQPQNYGMSLRKYEMSGGQQRLMSRWVVYGLQPKS